MQHYSQNKQDKQDKQDKQYKSGLESDETTSVSDNYKNMTLDRTLKDYIRP